MPRSAAKSKSKKGNVNTKSCCKSDKINLSTSKTKQTRIPKNEIANEKVIKEEFVATPETETATEKVCHRKSQRRRVARDIFLVFEEHPISRTRRTSKRQSKPKFGHLKVEEPVKSKVLLRDIKNEPRCYLSSTNVSVNVINATVPGVVLPILKTNSNLLKIRNEKQSKKEKNATTNVSDIHLDCSYKPSNKKNLKIDTKEKVATEDTRIVARVNPIFLWVKQDDTRIVEVRCEDYDKRNRIRITKTSNGWRAIPRSDPNSSRILKFYPTPLMKVKRETNINETNNFINVCNADPKVLTEKSKDKMDCKLSAVNSVCNTLATRKTKNKKKSKKGKIKRDKKFCKASNITQSDLLKLNMNSESIKMSPNNKQSNIISDKVDCLQVTKNAENLCLPTEIITNDYNKNITDLQILQTSPFSNTLNSNSIMENELETKSTYQNKAEENGCFQLCPKTGLFVPNSNSLDKLCEVVNATDYENSTINNSVDFEKSTINRNAELLSVDIDGEYNIESKLQLIEDNHESLEAKTKNLKDLLDNADLLQHCDDNANSDSELIDSLVKTSCEKNLIQSNEIISKGNLEHLQQKSVEETSEMFVRIITDVSDPPKCLSFNEAGEIEGLNGELFQSNAFIETFDKQTSTTFTDAQNALHSTTTAAVVTSESPHRHVNNDEFPGSIQTSDTNHGGVTDEFPKDLSYNKREEVCPPSESGSQCAVTSSSDVIKSPMHDDASVFASSSETLKNIILEQFMKLKSISNQQQRDPLDLGKQRQTELSHTKDTYSSKTQQSKNFFETVVIDDDDNVNIDEPPLKKRLRLNGHNVTKSMSNSKNKISLIDKDPDPLTQLRLLIQNTQWKVPDPILVPKDRLSAVLASPAREIPLLITTRPELRLPEAFAYPEIIQNPNILVISMAQLEAILKNDFAMEMFSCSQDLEPDKDIHSKNVHLPVQSNNQVKDFHSQTCRQRIPQSPKQLTNILNSNNNQIPNSILNNSLESSSQLRKKDENAKCSQTDSLPSDLNAATMAVLNQMLWLPYFGQISQDIIKSIKNPLVLQEKFLKFPPLCNSYANNAINLDNINKGTNISGETVTALASNTALPNFAQPNNELSVFHKIVQHQMQNVIELNHITPESDQQKNSQLKNSIELHHQTVENVADFSKDSSKYSEQKSRKSIELNKDETNFTSVCKNSTTTINNALEKSYNLRSSVAGRHSSDFKQYKNQRPAADYKPRLTCKSLSNLLNPQHRAVPTSSSLNTYDSHLSSDFFRNANGMNISSTDCKVNDESSKRSINASNNSHVACQPCNLQNVSIESVKEFDKQRNVPFTNNIASQNTTGNNDVSGLSTDTNIPIWHPLFGSNPKSSYSSPWQWTTVTATGE